MAIPTHHDIQFKIRIPAELKARIDAAAKDNSRSTTAEIVAALEEKYPSPSAEFEKASAQTMKDGVTRRAWLLDEYVVIRKVDGMLQVWHEGNEPPVP